MPRSNETLLRFAGICLPIVLATVGARSALKPPNNAAVISAGIPTAEEFDSLSKYLAARPSQGVPEITSTQRVRQDLFDPFTAGDFVALTDTAGAVTVVPKVRDRYVVTAILISRDRRVAVIDEALVSVGSILPGGVRVTAIETDHVEIVAPSGTRRMLAIKDSDGP